MNSGATIAFSAILMDALYNGQGLLSFLEPVLPGGSPYLPAVVTESGIR